MFAPILPNPIIPICMVFLPLRSKVAGVVPEKDCGLVEPVLVSERPESGRAEEEVPGRVRSEAEPARREDPEKVSAREEEHVTAHRSASRHDPIRTGSYLGRALAARAAVPEQIPVRPLGVHLRAPPTLVPSVVPFQEIGVDFGHLAVASQLAGAGSSLERAGEDPDEGSASEACSQPA